MFNTIDAVFNELKNVSKEICSDDVKIGISYFIYNDSKHLKYKLEYEIIPILREYFKDGVLNRRAKCEKYRFEEIFTNKVKEQEFIHFLLEKEK